MAEQEVEVQVAGGDPELLCAVADAAREAGGGLRFDRFMGMALYHPEHGYYTRDRSRVGRGGDFVTSVSVGSCFGMLLARQLAPELQRLAEGGAGEVLLAEAGPEGGELALDLVAELGRLLPPEVFASLRYIAVEPFAGKRDRLAEVLRTHGFGRFEIVSEWRELGGARGAVVANEVLDAMPLRRFRLHEGEWAEIYVEVEGGRCRESLRSVAAPDRDGRDPDLSSWPSGLQDGFTVEWNAALDTWFGEIGAAFESAYGLFIDYGLERSAEFFDPGRRGGTLRAYMGQRLIEDPLSSPGLSDLTAHVDFERAGEAAAAAGFELLSLTDQHRFLTRAARPWLLELEGRGAPDAATAKLLRQFQSLTHPAAMGMAFKVMELRTPPRDH